MASQVLITPEELSTLIASEPTVLIDTRDPKSYAAGHIPMPSISTRFSLTSPPPRPKAWRH
jgi:rhodanese-related sulfurtransferase